MIKVGIIVFGNMGQAIAERIKSDYTVCVFDKDNHKTVHLTGISVCASLSELLSRCEEIILAVKPQDFELVLKEIGSGATHKLFISIAAGITTAHIEKYLSLARVVRAMPNIAAIIGEAETCLAKGKYALAEDMEIARQIFGFIGKVWVMEEGLINAATAISGSGPAYIFYDLEKRGIDGALVTVDLKEEYIQRLEQAAQAVGFDGQTALELANSTVLSSLHLAAGNSPAELRKKVTSKGGTTEEALKVLCAGGSWILAAGAAKTRAKELSR